MASEKQNRMLKSEKKQVIDEFNETDPLNINTEEKAEEKKRTFNETLCFAIKNVTVEPIMLFFVTASVFSMFVSQNLILEKACRVNLNYTTEICDALKQQTLGQQNVYERDVQQLVAVALAKRALIAATIPCIIACFVGSWSDKTGRRKLFLITSLTGQIFVGVNGLINTYFFEQLPLEAVVYPEAILESLSGSWCLIFLTIYSYISVITTNENRTFRLGIASFTLTVGFPLGTSISGILLKSTSYYGSYIIVISINVINLLYTTFVLKDPNRSPEQMKHDGKGVLYFFRTFFDFKNVIITFKTLLKEGQNSRRLKICMIFFVTSTIYGPLHGEFSILYIFTRYRFNWDELKFSFFHTYNTIAHTIGTIFSITVFTKILKWHDSVLGLLSTLSKIAGSLMYCFAPNEKFFFIAPIVDMFNGMSLVAIRSHSSKLVSPEEFGKMNSIFALSENFTPLVYTTLYTKVYVATMEVLPGAVFLIGASLTITSIALFAWIYWEYKVNQNKQKIRNKR